MVHIDNLKIYLQRRELLAPSAVHAHVDAQRWRSILDSSVQTKRDRRPVTRGPRGYLTDYVPFYFGARSPMLYRLHTNMVEGHTTGQQGIVYLVASAQSIHRAGLRYVFFDRHALAAYATCYDDIAHLADLDWEAIESERWSRSDDRDWKSRKQAEFLVYQRVGWEHILGIATLDEPTKIEVEGLLTTFGISTPPPVAVRTKWYY